MNNNSLPLVTILTPTFNDERYLPILAKSVLSQTYENWQWIIIDDGSSDGTADILSGLNDHRIIKLRKENGDQLNALRFAIPYIRGDHVTMMHSDDCYVSNDSVRECVLVLQDPAIDGVYGDFITIDKDGQVSGRLLTLDEIDETLAARTVVQMGNNYIGDPFFIRKELFFSHIVKNYINSNIIYYFPYADGEKSLRLKKIGPWYAYRVFSENYINSDIGKFVALSGQFRTVSYLISAGIRPFLNVMLGYAGFRILRKLNIYVCLGSVSKRRYGSLFFGFWQKDIVRHQYPDILVRVAGAIACSFACQGEESRPLDLSGRIPDCVYGPADARSFFRLFQSGELPAVWLELLDCHFDHIVVHTSEEAEKVASMLEFFSLQYPVIKK